MIWSALIASAVAAEPDARPGLLVAQGTTLVLTGFQTGSYLGTALWYGPTKKGLTFEEYVQVQGSPNGLNTTTIPWEPLLVPLTVGANVAPVAMIRARDNKPALAAHAVGLALNTAMLVPMIGWKARISDTTRSWTPDQQPPADWTRLRSQWEGANLAMGLLSLGAMVANTTGTVLE